MEAAILMPIIFMLIFGMIEIGGALKSYSSVANGVRAGGRIASAVGNDAMADQLILERLASEVAGINRDEIDYVVIWKATGTGTTPPASCLLPVAAQPNQSSRGVAGSCNIYFRPQAAGGAFDMALGRALQPADYYFGCTGSADPLAAQKVDCSWPGQDRRVSTPPRGSAGTPPDYLGVHIRAIHPYVTKILGSTLTITDNAVNLLEPQGYDLGLN